MQRLPGVGSKTERVLFGLAKTLALARVMSPEVTAVLADSFRPEGLTSRETSAMLHNMKRRGVTLKAGRGAWSLSERGYELVARLTDRRRSQSSRHLRARRSKRS